MANVKSRLDEALTEQSKYCYPNTDVLINKLGITNQEDLDIAERRITTLMLMDLQTTPLPKPGTFFTPEYYFSLHKKHLNTSILLLEKLEMKISQKEIRHFVDQNICIHICVRLLMI